MVNDNPGNHPFDANRKTAGDDAPVFVRDCGDFLMRLSDNGSIDIDRLIKSGYLSCLALVYALIFTFAGWLFPQTYQAWLDFCMPLAEFVGGLTPLAGRVNEQLIANGYPERADDALHGIAMSRVLLIPAIIVLLASVFVTNTPRKVSCTRWTRAKVWLLMATPFVAGVGLAWIWGFVRNESFGYTVGFISMDDYHRGNFAMVVDVFMSYFVCVVIAAGLAMILRMRYVRFTIVKQQPDPKP